MSAVQISKEQVAEAAAAYEKALAEHPELHRAEEEMEKATEAAKPKKARKKTGKKRKASRKGKSKRSAD